MGLGIGDTVFVQPNGFAHTPLGIIGVIEEIHTESTFGTLYLVEAQDGRMDWFREEELRKLHA